MKPGQHFRNLRILVLAMDGWTGRMLADHFGLTQGFISIIVHRESQKRGIVMGRRKEERAEKPAPKTVEGIIVRPREPREFRPITLPTALRVNGARAAAAEPHLRAIASTPSQEWVD